MRVLSACSKSARATASRRRCSPTCPASCGVWNAGPTLPVTARANLTRLGILNVEVALGDGTEGLPEHAPYDAILISAAFPRVPPPLVEQLALGGRLIQPIGPGGEERVVLFEKGSEGLRRRRTIVGAHFVRLYGAHAFPG